MSEIKTDFNNIGIGRLYDLSAHLKKAFDDNRPASFYEEDIKLLSSMMPELWYSQSYEGSAAFDEEMVDGIGRIREYALSGEDEQKTLALTCACYLFAENPLDHKGCVSVDDVSSCVLGFEGDFCRELDRLVRDPHFLGFMFSLRFFDEVDVMFKERSVEELFELLRTRTGEPSLRGKLVERYIKRGPQSYLYWWKNNLDLYEFKTEEALALKGEIEAVSFGGRDMAGIRECLKTLEELSGRFRGLFTDNIFLVRLGIADEKDAVRVLDGSGCWNFDFMGKKVPIGFGRYLGEEISLEGVCEKAGARVEEIARHLEELSAEASRADSLYVEYTHLEVIKKLLYIVTGVLALVSGRAITGYGETLISSRLYLGSLSGYMPRLYYFVFIVFVAWSGWQLVRIFSSRATSGRMHTLGSLADRLRDDMKSEKELLSAGSGKILEASGWGAGAKGTDYKAEIERYHERIGETKGRTQIVAALVPTMVLMVLTAVHFWYLGRYSAWAMGESYDFYSALCACVSYLLLYALFYWIELGLCDLLERFEKTAAMVVFMAYQIGMGIFMAMNNLLTPIRNILPGDIGGTLGGAAGALNDHILTRGAMLLIFSTIFGAALIIGTQARDESRYLREGLIMPGKDGGNITYSPDDVRKGNLNLIFFTAVFMVLDARLVSNLAHNITPLKAGAYIFLGGVWSVIFLLCTAEDKEALYGLRFVIIFCTMYAGYVFMTLAGILGFDLRVFLFVLLQPLPLLIIFKPISMKLK